ncbi:hypothetical protein ACFSCX_06820 [Bacillus salitolerans]|uniref:TrbC/VirB2 family protein n=1 Tax=Bacillus salitolerans TaxID=1437434 RepID=A0ABW4LM66_9BACI
MKNAKKFLSLLAVLAVAVLVMNFAPVDAAAKVDISDALSKSGISSGNSLETAGLFKDLNTIVGIIIAIGGFWIIGCLVWGGMTLAGAGGNPQKRTEGFIKLSMVLVGAYIIVKAYDIAGYITNIG